MPIAIRYDFCRHFTISALHMEHEEETHKENADLLAKKLRDYDSNVWKLLSQAMERSLTRKIRRPRFP